MEKTIEDMLDTINTLSKQIKDLQEQKEEEKKKLIPEKWYPYDPISIDDIYHTVQPTQWSFHN